MSIGQIAPQIPFAGSADKPVSVAAEPMHVENRDVKTRQFESVMRNVAQHDTAVHVDAKPQQRTKAAAAEPEQQATTQSVDEKQLLRTVSTLETNGMQATKGSEETLAVVEEQQPLAQTIPQNVDENAIEALITTLVPQLTGRMPESVLGSKASEIITEAGNTSAAPVMAEAKPVLNSAPLKAVEVASSELPADRSAKPVAPDTPTQQTMKIATMAVDTASKASLDLYPSRVTETVGVKATPQFQVEPKAEVTTVVQAAQAVDPVPEVKTALVEKVAPQVEKPVLQQVTVSSVAQPQQTQNVVAASAAPTMQQTVPATTKATATSVAVEMAQKVIAPAVTAPAQQQAQNVPVTPTVVENVPAEQTLKAVVAVTELETPAIDSRPELSAARTETAPAVSKVPMQQIMEAYSRPFTTAPDAKESLTRMPNQLETEVVVQAGVQPVVQEAVVPVTKSQSQVAAPVATPLRQPADTMDAVVKTTVVPATQELGTQKAAQTPLPAVTVTPEQPQMVSTDVPVQRAIETGTIPAHAVVKNAGDRMVRQEEKLQQSAPEATDLKTVAAAEKILPGAVKAVAAAMTGEEAGNNGKPPSDQTMGGQIHQMVSQQIKTEPAAPTTAPASVTPGITEQVVKQVSEHFTKNEIKNGSEQIVFRLSPENLGELKVNVRMENQRLTVEIVTENRMVRDAILQNSDALKDSLAKQNIKMDSFDVTTGGNNSEFGGRNQNEWREVAQNRQSRQWQQAGGYNLPKDALPQKMAYNRPAEYGVLDVHF